jgi:ABC-type nitrate/sulfonate/bicarbonate transport system substrate-binding protein
MAISKTPKSAKVEASSSAQMNLTDGLALIAQLLAEQPNLKEDLGEIAEMVTGKLTKKEARNPKAKGAKPTKSAARKKVQKFHTAPLNWKEVWYTNCPLISASNVDQELGWTREEFKKLGVEYAYFRSTRDNDYYPHYIHNLDNLIRFGGLFPPIAVHADVRRTRLLGVTHAPHEGGCMMVRARDDLYRMDELKGKKIGLSKSLNTVKNDWWRCQEHQGIELMLRINGMTMDDVEIVEFPYPDDWYNDPKMLEPMVNPSDLWLQRDHKHDLAFRPLETALEQGIVDAIYTQSRVFQHLQEATGKFKAIEDLSKYPDWTLQVANIPAAITCSDVMAEEHPELVVAFMKGMIRVGRWANEHKHAAAAILDRQTFYLDVEDTYEGIKHMDLVPNLSPQNMVAVEIGKDFLLSHGYIKNDFDVHKWAAPEFLEQAARDLLEDEWKKRTTSKLPKTAASLASGKRLG